MEVTDAPEPKRRWFEPVCAILMAVASVATAWCSYQSAKWSAQHGDLEMEGGKHDRKLTAIHLEARQIEAMQMRFFMEVVDAHLQGNSKLEAFYVDRFSDELKPAFAKWIALNPYNNPAAPPHPFVPEFYKSRFEPEIHHAKSEASRIGRDSKLAEDYASRYLSLTVALATVLFFAGMADKFDQRRVRSGALAFAFALFAFAAVRMAMLPVA